MKENEISDLMKFPTTKNTYILIQWHLPKDLANRFDDSWNNVSLNKYVIKMRFL